jgi:hypothetical protein
MCWGKAGRFIKKIVVQDIIDKDWDFNFAEY